MRGYVEKELVRFIMLSFVRRELVLGGCTTVLLGRE